METKGRGGGGKNFLFTTILKTIILNSIILKTILSIYNTEIAGNRRLRREKNKQDNNRSNYTNI